MFIQGTIEDIIYRNDENGYTVALVSVNDAKLETVVGKFLKVNKGEIYRFEGEFVENKRYGKQFSFTSYEVVTPSDEEGIIKFLSSGLIHGVGEVTARNIVKEFGKETLEIIEFAPDKLIKVKGISKTKADVISESLMEVKNLQNAVLFLQKYQISINLALKIYERYKNKTVELVSENPYRLVEDIDGVGFLSADKIACNMGIGPDSEFRIRAGVFHLLNENSEKNGNTYEQKPALFDKLVELLDIPEDVCEKIFNSVLETLKLEGIVKVFWVDKCEAVMLMKYYYLENTVAQKLALLCATSKVDNLNIDEDIYLYEQQRKIKFHEEQKLALTNAVNSGVSVITGGPGTGKTTIVSCLLSVFSSMKKKVLLVAPTGRAAKRLSESTGANASTIHRALELDFRSEKGMFVYNESNPLPYNVVIVDEVSMVDVSLFNCLLKALPRDAKLVLIGDKDQLPSVGAGNVLADILTSGIIKVSALTKIFRQDEDSLIIINAHAINNGEMPIFNNKSKDFFFDSKEEVPDIKTSVVEMCTERIPKFLNIDKSKIQVLAPLKAGLCGIENLNLELQEKINPKTRYKNEVTVGTVTFREGDKVMQIANNYEVEWKKKVNFILEEGKGVFNGDIGYIHSINSQTGEVMVWFEDGREAVYPRGELSQLSLAYAITIHKSQGCEFDVVIIPVIAGARMIFTRNLIYTAVTRAKKMVVLVGSKVNLRRMINNKYTSKRLTMLSKFLVDSNRKMVELYGE